MRLIASACIWLLLAPSAFAYPEYPPFEQTSFRNDYGMFRWWQNCWWRVVDPYVYLLCGENGDIWILYPDGTLRRASRADLGRLFRLDGMVSRFHAPPPLPRRVSRWSARRLTPAPGHGISLSEYYGRPVRFDDSRFGGGGGSFDGRDRRDRGHRGDKGDGSDRGDRGSRGDRGDSDNPLTRPTGFFCESIDDFVDGGALGPIPCTSYPGVFGPKVRY